MTVPSLNYWLGKIARLQMFGHGVLPLFVRVDGVERELSSVDADTQRGIVVINLK